MTDRPPWWAGLADAVAHLDCSGSRHQVRWHRGRLHLDDHDDPGAEQALAALGGDPPACFVLSAAWTGHCTDPHLVTLGRRPGEATLGFENMSPPAPQRVPSSYSGISAVVVRRLEAMSRRRSELMLLLSLPGPLIDRLVLTVLASCAERWGDEAFRAEHGLRLGAALSVRATPAIHRLSRRLGGGTPDIGVSPLWPGRVTPVIAARLEPENPVVSAELPIDWLSNVWGRGISEPEDEFVLDVRGGAEDGSSFDVFVAEWEPAGPMTWEAAPVPARVTIAADGTRQVDRDW